MPENNEGAIVAVAEAIQRYLDTHPHAADSADGIARWWVTRQRFEEARETVEQALAYLEARGEVTKTVTQEGKILYARAKGT